MAFFTSLIYYRPGKPPIITVNALCKFIERIGEANILLLDSIGAIQIKFGNSIDQDEKNATTEKILASGLTELGSIDWDIDLSDANLEQIKHILQNDQRRIYRAFVSLGPPLYEIVTSITRINSLENPVDFCPVCFNIQIGPISLCEMNTEEPYLVGWIGVDISGFGYLFPWTFRDVVNRLEANADVQRIKETCRSSWPVPSEIPNEQMIAARKAIGGLWPYDDYKMPRDWYWGLSETG